MKPLRRQGEEPTGETAATAGARELQDRQEGLTAPVFTPTQLSASRVCPEH